MELVAGRARERVDETLESVQILLVLGVGWRLWVGGASHVRRALGASRFRFYLILIWALWVLGSLGYVWPRGFV